MQLVRMMLNLKTSLVNLEMNFGGSDLPKNIADVPAFLNMQWIATFVTVDGRGKPHAVPVWFTFDDGKFHVQTDRSSVKVRNVHSNPYVAIAVYDMRDEAVCVRGRAQLVSDEEEFRRLTQVHIDKYNRLHNVANSTDGIEYIKLDTHGRDAMGIALFDYKVRCVVEVKPERTLFW